MKQTIVIRRMQVMKVELEVPQPLAKETLEKLANDALAGAGGPAFGNQVANELSQWTVVRAEPSCECAPKARKRSR